MEYSSLTDFLKKYEIDDVESYLIKRVKAVNASKDLHRNYNKQIWINRLADFYKQKGVEIGKIGFLISEKTEVNYSFIIRYMDLDYKQKIERLDFMKENIINFYNQCNNLTLTANEFQTSNNSLSDKLKSWGLDVGTRTRHIMKMKQIKKIPKKLSFLENGKVYKLHAAWCDYFYHDHFGNNCTIIEEKRALSKYNYGQAAMQLFLGKKIIEEQTEHKIDHLIILTHGITNYKGNRITIYRALIDLSRYYGIELIIPSLDE